MLWAGRVMVGFFVIAVLVSSATVYSYGASWYQYFWVASSLRQGLHVLWENFSVIVPSQQNGTIIVLSHIYMKNLSPIEVNVTEVFQGVYLGSFATSNTISTGDSGRLVQFSTSSEAVIPMKLSASMAQKSVLISAANSSGHWLWITWIILQLQASNGRYGLCYMGLNRAPPNTTSLETDLTVSGCEGPTQMGGGPGGS